MRATYPRLFRALDQYKRPVGTLGRIGDHTMFYGRAIAGCPRATVHFRREIIRLIAEISAATFSQATLFSLVARLQVTTVTELLITGMRVAHSEST